MLCNVIYCNVIQFNVIVTWAAGVSYKSAPGAGLISYRQLQIFRELQDDIGTNEADLRMCNQLGDLCFPMMFEDS